MWATGPAALVGPALERATGAAVDGFRALGLPVNVAKSAVLAATPDLERALGGPIGGVPVVRASVDLGVEVRFGPRAGPAHGLGGRFGVAALRVRHVARLPMAPRQRAPLVASAVIPAASYGALAASATAADVRRLRAAARAAVHPRWQWGAPEVVLALDFPDGRADPAAAVGPKVLATLARLLRAGVLPPR